ncbi:FMN-dependent NADH-azoreductase [Salipaludibacillus agaradhaerens]|jgi:FMN-dependent NADH-azoreductase|uniref:FMN dependent NADH:quinone oxidoreductase n=1 Tax=Salipaludibacillus agaradhaerens TaxID=76935 RepID=A0A9Q4B3V6_SALAG|nr:FMN-dependent NADH-azoreductase [Salipaludibacillus agaradhaerens]UJW56517.1 FMN-dependent NADH-azoreductase [Bacillus sp. A116_S68]MCR6097873.1 FMN-dependent NADH-azoreductase [Salipaludibacillus agaradhaerens]MCR6105272.1 FMN-dependent NADH-azoreductase [Salipaludibacillus agaradhaerens]MCR6116498.1 FMN-dependent NADH-azoreductase [Salipaludibacillus agaradhaerens]MCR6117313.1 FMN-dependent NADH-azoreductase [Salipaludibacillus agaradhaerens]
MANVLFIKANSRPADQAISVKLYNSFVESYKQAHPEDTITELDLFKENLPYYDTDKINGMFKLAQGMELTDAEKQATDLVTSYLNQFLEADKVVFAFPLWNFTVPAVLHTYMDYLAQAGKTFKYTEQGPVGLLTDKKVALLNARGGVYSEGPAAANEMAVNFISGMLQFWGVSDIEKVIVEGHNQFPDKAESIVEEGVQKAAELAKQF